LCVARGRRSRIPLQKTGTLTGGESVTKRNIRKQASGRKRDAEHIGNGERD
jgi:hypothetical protein